MNLTNILSLWGPLEVAGGGAIFLIGVFFAGRSGVLKVQRDKEEELRGTFTQINASFAQLTAINKEIAEAQGARVQQLQAEVAENRVKIAAFEHREGGGRDVELSDLRSQVEELTMELRMFQARAAQTGIDQETIHALSSPTRGLALERGREQDADADADADERGGVP